MDIAPSCFRLARRKKHSVKMLFQGTGGWWVFNILLLMTRLVSSFTFGLL
jgi:hypothetical protein